MIVYLNLHIPEVSHGTVNNYVEIIEADQLKTLSTDERVSLEAVNNSAKRMNSLIKSLLEFSRLGLNKKLTYVDCKRLIAKIIDALDSMLISLKAILKVSKMAILNTSKDKMLRLFKILMRRGKISGKQE